MGARISSRRADPYRDLAVVDARAPRFNQAAVGLVSLIAFGTGAWPLYGLMAAQLMIGLHFGRRYCLPCWFYFELIQPRVGEGPLEDARAPKFANVLGASLLSAATLASAVGLRAVGQGIGLLVAVFALLAAATGFCLGCELYRLNARVRGVRGRALDRIDLEDLGAPDRNQMVVQFSHPLCTDCRALEERLAAEGREVILVDVSKRPDLAKKYGVALVPLAYAVSGDGRILSRVH